VLCQNSGGLVTGYDMTLDTRLVSMLETRTFHWPTSRSAVCARQGKRSTADRVSQSAVLAFHET
jgi:hypothetical protein